MYEENRLTVRIPPALLDKIDKRAEREYPSRIGKRANRSQVVLDALEFYLKGDNNSDNNYPDERLETLEAIVNEMKTRLENLERINSEATQQTEETPQQRELTTAELARLLNKNPSTVSRWSTGKSQPPEDLKWKFDPVKKVWISPLKGFM